MWKGVNSAESNSTEIRLRPWRMTPGVLHAKRPPRKRLRSNAVIVLVGTSQPTAHNDDSLWPRDLSPHSSKFPKNN